MVLSLADICLRSIIDGVEKQKLRNVHYFVPQKFRQRLLTTVVGRGKIDNPIWELELSSKEFLRGFSTSIVQRQDGTSDEYSSFDTQNGKANDSDYLTLVAESLGSISENGETIGSRIKKLKLALYLNKIKADVVETNLVGIVQLIGRCSNLKSLNLKTTPYYSFYDLWLFNRLESTESCRAVLENLDEISIDSSSGMSLLTDDYSVIDFKKLKSIRLVDCNLDGGRWVELLNSVRETLIDLDLSGVGVDPSDLLPIPLPHLVSLKLDTCNCRCTSELVANLQRCSKLEYVYLSLEWYSRRGWVSFAEDEEQLKALTRIKAELEVKICLWTDIDSSLDILDDNSRFKMVSIFEETISYLKLSVHPWIARYTTALEHVVDVCRNLTRFAFESPSAYYDGSWPRRDEANSALVRFFGDRERASKLRTFKLKGDIDSLVLALIFENSSNLDTLKIVDNAQLGDSHLIEWVDRGAKPSQLHFDNCDNITDDGLIPILVNSGNRLTSIVVKSSPRQQRRITDHSWRVMLDHCPNVETVCGMPWHLEEVARSKCFNTDVWVFDIGI